MIGVLATRDPYRHHLQPVADALGVEVITTVQQARATDADLWLVASYRDFVALPERRRVMMEHGCGLEFYPRTKLLRLAQATAIAAPNDFVASLYRAKLPEARVEIVGTPKLDRAPKAGSADVVAVSLHWTGLQGPPPNLQTTRLYRDAIEALAARMPVLGHAHPRIWNIAEKLYADIGVEPVQDFTEVVRRAGVYVSDRSSTLYEAAACGMTVVMLERQQRLPIHTSLAYETFEDIGPLVGPGELLQTFPLQDRWVTQRAAAVAALYPHRPHATERVVNLLRDLEV